MSVRLGEPEQKNKSGMGDFVLREITPTQMIGSSGAETCGMRGDVYVKESGG